MQLKLNPWILVLLLSCGLATPAIAETCTGRNLIDKTASACLASEVEESEINRVRLEQSLLQQLPKAKATEIEENQLAWIRTRDNACLLDSLQMPPALWFSEMKKNDGLMLCELRYIRNRTTQLEQSLSTSHPDLSRLTPQPLKNDDLASQLLSPNTHQHGLWYWEVTMDGNKIGKLAKKESVALEMMCTHTYEHAGNGWLAYSAPGDHHESSVFGIAIDLDMGRIYISQNGVWLNGIPGKTGGGQTLLGGKIICGVQSLQPIDDLKSNNIINVNFGQNNFAYPLPSGYKPFYQKPLWLHADTPELTLAIDYNSIDLAGQNPTVMIKNEFKNPQTLTNGTRYLEADAQYEINCASGTLRQNWTAFYAKDSSQHAVYLTQGAATLARMDQLGGNSIVAGMVKTVCTLKNNHLTLPPMGLMGKWDAMASPLPVVKIFEDIGDRQYGNGILLVRQKNQITSELLERNAGKGHILTGITAFDCRNNSAHQIVGMGFDKEGNLINGSFYDETSSTPKLEENRKRFTDACQKFAQENTQGAHREPIQNSSPSTPEANPPITSTVQANSSPAQTKPIPTYYKLSSPPTVQSLYSVCQLQKKDMVEKCDLIAAHIKKVEIKLNDLCRNAGENISHTVNNVEGVLINPPTITPFHYFQDYFHENDQRIWSSYINPTLGRNYTFWEVYMPWRGNLIGNRRLVPRGNGIQGDIKDSYKEIETPESQYGVTWKQLTTEAEQRDMLFGDETKIYQVKTGKTIAVRRIYFYVLGASSIAIGDGRYIQPPERRNFDFVRTCSNYSPPDDDAYIDRRPRDSYAFVSKVLKPKQVDAHLAVELFALARGVGQRMALGGSCIYESFGPNIRPDDLLLIRDANDLIIKIKDTKDSLRCNQYFGIWEKDFSNKSRFRFYDGLQWRFEDIMQNLKH